MVGMEDMRNAMSETKFLIPLPLKKKFFFVSSHIERRNTGNLPMFLIQSKSNQVMSTEM